MLLLKKVKEKGVKGSIKALKNRFFNITYGYRLELKINFLNINQSYKLVELNNNLIDKMRNEYKEEITTTKLRLLDERIKKNSKEKPYVVIDDFGEIYGYFHISYTDSWDNTMNYRVRVDADSVYLFDDYTFIKHRGKGVHGYSVIARMNIAQKKGYKFALVNIMNNNIPSEKTYCKMGFKKYKGYYYYNFKVFKKTFVKDFSL